MGKNSHCCLNISTRPLEKSFSAFTMVHLSTFLAAMCLAGASAMSPAQANAPPAFLRVAPQAMPAPRMPAPRMPAPRTSAPVAPTVPAYFKGLSADPLWRNCQPQRGGFDAVCDKCCFGGVTKMHCNEANCRLPCQPFSGCWLDDDHY